VRIAIESIKRKLFITIEDTGVGIADAQREIALGPQGANDNTHIGMANVLERIKLYYGSTSHMEVRPREPSGTVILLTLPIRKQDRLGAM